MFRLGKILSIIVIMVVFISCTDESYTAQKSISFKSPEVLNLSSGPLTSQGYIPIKIENLSLDIAQAVVRSPEWGWNNAGVIRYANNFTSRDESKLIAKD
jgi:hypothetical protein